MELFTEQVDPMLDAEQCMFEDIEISTKDYKTEFKTLLENLKCTNIQSPKQDVLSSLEDQIQNIIDEIRDMDTCIRNDIEKSIAEDESLDNICLDGYCTLGDIEARAEVMNLTQAEEFNRLPKPNIIDEISDDEIELQVIDLNSASNRFKEPFKMTPIGAGQELDEINLTKQGTESIPLEQGDQCEIKSNYRNEQPVTLEKNNIESSVSNSELEGNLKMCEKPETKKKKNLGSRLWIFFTKKHSSLKKQ